jgi:acyl-CoA synthetase (AMP-forming)/AMP-acid ligase II
VPAALGDAAERFGDALALTDGVARVGFVDLHRRAHQVARGLVAAGVQPGDRIVLWAQNRPEWPALCLGAACAGAVVVPLNTRLRALEALDAARVADAVAIFAVPELLGYRHLDELRSVAGGPGAGRPFAALASTRLAVALDDGPGSHGWTPLAEVLEAGEGVDAAEVHRRSAAVRPDDPFQILVSTAADGRQRGIVLTHQAQLRSYWHWSDVLGLSPEDRYLLTASYANGPGLAGMLAGLMRGVPTVFIDVFEPGAALRLIAAERVTAVLGPPSLHHRLLDGDDSGAGRTVRVAVCSTGPFPPDIAERLVREWDVSQLTTTYGSIEASVVTMSRAGDPASSVTASCGRPLPDVEVAIGDSDEVLVRSPAIATRWWGEPSPVTDVEGWFATGVTGALDPGGELRVTGRLRPAAVVNGFTVHPAEVEGLLRHHPDIARAVVLIDADGSGTRSHATITARPGRTLDPDAVRAWCQRSMARYKVPDRVHVVA